MLIIGVFVCSLIITIVIYLLTIEHALLRSTDKSVDLVRFQVFYAIKLLLINLAALLVIFYGFSKVSYKQSSTGVEAKENAAGSIVPVSPPTPSPLVNPASTAVANIKATAQALETQVAIIHATGTAFVLQENDDTAQATVEARATGASVQSTATAQALVLSEAIQKNFADAQATVEARVIGASVQSTATAQVQATHDAIKKSFADAQATTKARSTVASVQATKSVQATATAKAQATNDAIIKSIAAAQATVAARATATAEAEAMSEAIKKGFADAQATTKARSTVASVQATKSVQATATAKAQATNDAIAKSFADAQTTGEARAIATAAAKATSNAIATAFAGRPTYHTLSLSSIANKSTEEGYKSPPFGRIELAGVPFEMPRGQNSATTQAEGLPDFPTKLALLNLNIPHAKTVYLLITGGSTRNTFEGSTIGHVTFYFTNNHTYMQPIIPGWNIREWKDCCNPNVIHTSDPTVQEVWRSENNFDNGTATIDMWTIEIPENYRQQTLETIEITDRSTQAVGSKNPAINLLGVTVMGQE